MVVAFNRNQPANLETTQKESGTSRSIVRANPNRVQKFPIINRKLQVGVQNVPTEDQEETDVFEESTSTPSLSSQDNKVHLKRASNIEKSGFIPPPPPMDLNRLKIDFNRINELDRIHNLPICRNYFGHLLRAKSEKLRKDFLRDRDSLPGPSNAPPPKKRKKMRIVGTASDSEEDVSPLDDIKSMTNCILENTLNKLNVDEVKAKKDDVIEFNVVPVEETTNLKNEVVECNANKENNGNFEDPIPKLQGEMYTPIPQSSQQPTIPETTLENYLLRLISSTSDEYPNFRNLGVPIPPLPPMPLPLTNIASNFSNIMGPQNTPNENLDQNESNQDLESKSLARISREAIVDPNSVQDLLDDFDINSTNTEDLNGLDIVNIGSFIIVGIHPVTDALDIEQTINGFPNWLLQIFGTQVPISERPLNGTLEGSHYFCKGDGLGVHPSAIVDGEDDNESVDSDSSNTTTDFAEIDPGVSSQEMSSLPEDSLHIVSDTQDPLAENDPTSENINIVSTVSDITMQTSKSL